MIHGNWLGRWSMYAPDKAAIVDLASGAAVSYAALERRVDAAARVLRDDLGVDVGARVAVIGANRVEQVELYFATARLGAILVPVNWRLAADEVAYVLSDADPRLLLFGDDVADTVRALAGAGWTGPAVPFDGPAGDRWGDRVDARLDDGAAPVVTDGLTDDTPAMLLYTSGTTGRPKGAVLTHGTITWNAINTQVGWDLHHDDVTVTHTPFFHTGGWNVLTLPLLHRGGTVVLADRFDPGATLDAIGRHGVTVLFAVPTMFQMMLEHPRFADADLSPLRFFISGGAACPVPLIEAYQRRGVVFKQGYGLTEVGPNCFVLHERDAVRKAGSVGVPTMHLDTRVVDGDGRPVAAGEVGELQLRGPTVCAGYWQNPRASAAAMSADGWFATGDLFTVDDEGYHTVVGRLKEMYISGGENVYPAEVERVLYEVPAVTEAAVIGIPDERWGEVGHAFVAFGPVEGADGAEPPTEPQLLDHCRAQLARFKVPKRLTVLDELPKNASGKIHKLGLRGLVEGAER